jgi:nitrite reductase (NO-forming)/hydroxylamine reductase
MQILAGFRLPLLVGVAATLLAGAPAFAQEQQKPNPADLQQHRTTPGGQYQPSLDVLGEKPVENLF